jgi:hypothetical protein
MIEVLLKFYLHLLEGLESFLGSRDVIRDQIDVNGGCHASDEFMGSLFKGIVFPRVMCILCYQQELCPSSGV